MIATPDGVLAGRESELSILDGLVRDVLDGRGSTVWIEGEPGIGKSALLSQAMERVAAHGYTVLSAGGDELMEAFPLRLMADCLRVSTRSADSSRRELARLLQGDDGGLDALSIGGASERMVAVVDRICAGGPLVLALDDLQWADEASVGLWHRLARSVDQIPLLAMAACRTLPARPALRRLRTVLADRGAHVLDVGPLDSEAMTALAAAVLGAPPGARLAAELERAAGNPLYARELIDALVRDGLVRVAGGVAELTGSAGSTPQSLVAAVGARLGFLSASAHRALRLAALLGPEFDVPAWSNVTGRSVEDGLSDVADEAVASGVLRPEGRRLRFRHELIRQVLVEHSPQPVRVEIHRGIARTLAATGHPRDAVAGHLMLAGALDAWAVGWLVQASEGMVNTAPAVAAELLGRAVAAMDPEDDIGPVLRARLAQAYFWLGRPEEAIANAQAVVRQSADGELIGRARVLLVRACGRMGHFSDARAVASSGIYDLRVPPRWRARLAAWSTTILSDLDDREEFLARAEETLALGSDCGDAFSIAHALHEMAMMDTAGASNELRDKAMAALGERDEDAETAELRLRIVTRRLGALVDDARWHEYDVELPSALILGETIGTVRATYISAEAAFASYVRGRWDEAIDYVNSLPHPESGQLTYMQGYLAIIEYSRDQPGPAEQHLRAAGFIDEASLAQLSYPERYVLSEALALRVETTGDLAHALELRTPFLELPTVRQGGCTELAPDIVRLALELGEREVAQAVVRCVATVQPSRFQAIITECCQGLLEDDVDALLAAADRFHQHGWRPMQAFMLEEAAVRLASAGQTAPARTALTAAVKLYAELDASWRIRRADARLRRHNVRRYPGGPHRLAKHGWEALTPSEQRIAGLIARGLSDPDIAAELYLSRHTVQTHVSHILAKLGLRSRLDVMREYPRQQ